jgi:hypothetical protein
LGDYEASDRAAARLRDFPHLSGNFSARWLGRVALILLCLALAESSSAFFPHPRPIDARLHGGERQ